jgi:hypothetical protein
MNVEKLWSKPMDSNCRTCMFSKIEKEQLQKNIEEYIDCLSPEERTGERLYKERLELCLECSNFFNGLCRICGCFVSARAAKIRSYCPGIPKRW